MTNAQHSMVTAEHFTPSDIVEAARKVMGSIDLDPASCSKANEIVKAAGYFSREDDGLLHTWQGNVFLNPPGGREFPPDEAHTHGSGRWNSKLWWPKLAEEWSDSNVVQAVFVGFSLEILQNSQGGGSVLVPLDFPFCIPAARTKFLNENLVPQKDPTHANVLVYLPDNRDRFVREEGVERFHKEFSQFGRVVIPDKRRVW